MLYIDDRPAQDWLNDKEMQGHEGGLVVSMSGTGNVEAYIRLTDTKTLDSLIQTLTDLRAKWESP